MNRAQSSRENPAGVRSELRKERRWRTGDGNPAGTMTQQAQHRGSREGRGAGKQMGQINSDQPFA